MSAEPAHQFNPSVRQANFTYTMTVNAVKFRIQATAQNQ
jgi:hypothetical protein